MRKLFLICSLIYLANSANSQAVLLDVDVSKDTIVKKVGPNLRHFHHVFMGYGFVADKSEAGAEINYGKSTFFDVGYRYKLKVCKFYAIGTDLSWVSTTYNLKQNSFKVLPDTLLNEKEKLSFSSFNLGIYNRINYGRRGNHVGNFIDFGAYGQANVNLVHFTKNKMPNGSIQEVFNKKLKYYEPFTWGLHGRIGFNRYIFTGQYRMGNILKGSSSYPELPRLIVGFQIGFY